MNLILTTNLYKKLINFLKKIYFLLFKVKYDTILIAFKTYKMPVWRNGRRSGLKIHRWKHRAGSTPAIGIFYNIYTGEIYMRIQAVTPIVNFRAQNSRRTIQNNKSVTPVRDGLNTAGAWFGFGVGLDLLSRKIQFSKSPFKNSIALNGLISAGAGTFAFMQDRNKKSNAE